MQVVHSDDVCAGRGSLLGILTLGENGDAHGFAGAIGQHGGTADVLVRLAGIHAEADRDVNGFLELDLAGTLEQFQGLVDGIGLAGFDLFPDCFHAFT